MNGMEERGKPWNSAGGGMDDKDDAAATWKEFGTSMSAISLGFAATAILISMFIIMAIFERLIKPRTSSLFRSTNGPDVSSSQIERAEAHRNSSSSSRLKKLAMPTGVGSWCTTDLSVLMPGQHYPTFIAQPAPLPCSREEIHWPSHDHTHEFAL